MFTIQNQKIVLEGNESLKPQAHSDYINDLPNLYGNDVDVMVEAKKKNYRYFHLLILIDVSIVDY